MLRIKHCVTKGWTYLLCLSLGEISSFNQTKIYTELPKHRPNEMVSKTGRFTQLLKGYLQYDMEQKKNEKIAKSKKVDLPNNRWSIFNMTWKINLTQNTEISDSIFNQINAIYYNLTKIIS